MSSAAEGWYVDPSTGTNLRYWNGITWTDEVAPLPDEAPKKPVFAGVEVEPAADTVAEPAAEPVAATLAEVADAVAGPIAEPIAEPAAEPAAVEPPPAAEIPDLVVAPLDPELEHTRLTRRELRARRGGDPDLNDAPKHLPPMTPPSAGEPVDGQEPEEVEISIAEIAEHPPVVAAPPEVSPVGAEPVVSGPRETDETEADGAEGEETEADDPRQRRTRIVRLSVLLGILAVVSSVGVLTAGTL